MCKSELAEIFFLVLAEVTKCGAELSKFSLPKQYALKTVFRPLPSQVRVHGPSSVRESETTIKNKICTFRGGGGGRGAERKIVQNAIFHGRRHDNKILKVKILLSRNFVVMAQAPILTLFDMNAGGFQQNNERAREHNTISLQGKSSDNPYPPN